jgi:hypothetical protein
MRRQRGGIVWYLERNLLRVGIEHCPHCNQADICISRPNSLWEEIAILLLLRPVRCRDCMRRFYRPLFVATPLAPESSVGSKKQPAAGKNEEGRSA